MWGRTTVCSNNRKKSLLNYSNDNGQIKISFDASNGFIIKSTTFPHKNIHKYTWKSPDVKTMNQTNHVMIQNRYCSTIADVQSFREVDCNIDHFMIIKSTD